ncbi:MAG: hypothetical protein LH481_04060, partial [Burkholderiales bacterium]|nr:hypothetical protein [Burkholderiales bacterium]
ANTRIAHGPRAGQKVLSLQMAPRRLARGGESSVLCANAHGFSLMTGRGWNSYAAPSPARRQANERLSVSRAGQVAKN